MSKFALLYLAAAATNACSTSIKPLANSNHGMSNKGAIADIIADMEPLGTSQQGMNIAITY